MTTKIQERFPALKEGNQVTIVFGKEGKKAKKITATVSFVGSKIIRTISPIQRIYNNEIQSAEAADSTTVFEENILRNYMGTRGPMRDLFSDRLEDTFGGKFIKD